MPFGSFILAVVPAPKINMPVRSPLRSVTLLPSATWGASIAPSVTSVTAASSLSSVMSSSVVKLFQSGLTARSAGR